MESIKHLILYQNLEQEKLFYDMVWIMEHDKTGTHENKEIVGLFYECFGKLAELAASHGFCGNLWHDFLAFLLVSNENAYSKACEIRGEATGSVSRIARHDFSIIREFFQFDFRAFAERHRVDCMDAFLQYEGTAQDGRVLSGRISARICELAEELAGAEDLDSFQAAVVAFYREFGVGAIGLHKAFRIRHREDGAEILPIANIARVKLEDLVGYELAKQKLIDNTEAFVRGKEANNCLLFGAAGTGKSTSIKAIANQYYEKGLRLIEVYKHQFGDLSSLIAQIKNRNYKFIIYLDDLSFEEFEVEYKYLKAVIEGGLEKKPDNVLIYATSNRRHLIREYFSDKEEIREDMHASDTVQEKLSLYGRFGVTIYFGSPNQKEFQQIVKTLAERNGIAMEEQELLAEANRWELSHGGLSGRTAQQFVSYLLGRTETI